MNIAAVYPMRRLPRDMGPFDYICHDSVEIGDLVSINFKGVQMPGVVWNFLDSSDFSDLDEVSDILRSSYFSKGDIARINSLSLITSHSPSSYLHLLKSKKYSPSSITYTQPSFTSEDIASVKSGIINNSCFHVSPNLWPLYISGLRSKDNQTLVVAPNEEIAHYIAESLPRTFKAALSVQDSSSDLQQRWRVGDISILITTRNGSLLPANRLGSVIIVDDAHPDYDFRPRNPRFDVRFAAYLQSEQHGCPLYRVGHAHDLSSHRSHPDSCFVDSLPLIQYLNPSEHPQESPYLTLPISNAIESSLHASPAYCIVLYLNKSGIANHFQCRGCGHLPTCGKCGAIPVIRENDLICSSCGIEMWHPESCPSCHKKLLTKKGVGVDHVVSALQKLYPEATISVNVPSGQSPWPQFLVLSEQGMRTLSLSSSAPLSLFVDLSCDYHFLDESYRSDAYAQYKLLRSAFLGKNHKVPCIFQAYQIDRVQALLSPAWQDQESSLRKSHNLPPYAIQCTHTRHEDKSVDIQRFIDKNEFLAYLEAFKELPNRDILDVDSQIEAYESITPSK